MNDFKELEMINLQLSELEADRLAEVLDLFIDMQADVVPDVVNDLVNEGDYKGASNELRRLLVATRLHERLLHETKTQECCGSCSKKCC